MSVREVSALFTNEQLTYLSTHPAVVSARQSLENGANQVSFSIPLTESLKETLQTTFGLTLTVDAIPMRWVRGDTAPHVDTGRASFETTYLAYLTDVVGEFLIGGTSYSLAKNTGFSFQEGVSHETRDTGAEPRLLLGPMSEQGFAVGAVFFIRYYPSESDALNFTNQLAENTTDFVVGTVNSGSIGSITHWRIASNSSGPANQSLVYTNGQTLSGTPSVDYYYLYPGVPCFLEGSKILCHVDNQDTYVPIEQIRPGTLVKTSRDGYKKVELIGKGPLQNPGTTERLENRLYRLSPAQYPALTEDLFLTGCHSILVDDITDVQRQETVRHLGRVFITDKKYRLMACLDDRAEPWASEGTYTIWHIALENADERMNYGVYANGLLVETCSLRFLRSRSNMTLL